MLFHITSTHTEDNCPGYHTEKIPAVLEALPVVTAEELIELARQLQAQARA